MLRNLDPMRPDDDDSDVLNHPDIRLLRNIPAMRHFKFLNDAKLARKYLLGDTVADEPEEQAQAPGESKNTTAEEDAALIQNRAKGQRFTTDKRIGSVAPGESQPDSETAALRRKRMAPSDYDYLDGKEGADKWRNAHRF
jgi:hypothetical protein